MKTRPFLTQKKRYYSYVDIIHTDIILMLIMVNFRFSISLNFFDFYFVILILHSCYIFQPPRIGGVKVYIENVKRDEIILDTELL